MIEIEGTKLSYKITTTAHIPDNEAITVHALPERAMNVRVRLHKNAQMAPDTLGAGYVWWYYHYTEPQMIPQFG